VENKRKQMTVIVVKSKERGTRTKVTTCAYSYDGNLIGGGELQYSLFGGIFFVDERSSHFPLLLI
jgi:hypothetical protein